MSDQRTVIFGGRYELHRRIARGGMADVYLARDQLLDRPVAVKVLFSEYSTDPTFVERFRREAQAAANLSHPNIVGVYDWGEEDGTYFIVMEYVAGRSLAAVLRSEGTLLPERAADIAIDIAAALGFAHRNGVVHRDVKPGNVILSPDGQVKVTDFGIARAISAAVEENLTQTGLVMGTATYFSPEQAQGKNVDPRSDVYALGVVLYEMVVGRPPFQGEDPLAVAYQHVQEPPTSPRHHNPDLDTALDAIILKCLAKTPVDRYPSAEDLRSDLRRYREGHRLLANSTEHATSAVAVPATAMIPVNQETETAAFAAPSTTAVEPAAEYWDDEPYDEEPRRRNPWFFVVLVALLAVLVGLLVLLWDALGLADDGPAVPLVAVPSVIDMDVEAARALLEEQGFDVEEDFVDNEQVEPNVVFAQDPPGGERVDEGSTVELQVSAPEEIIPVPEVIDSTVEDARRILVAAGFDEANIQTENVFSDDFDEGVVAEQDPDPDSEAPVSATITLSVSQGPADRPVPDVSGLSPSQASNRLGRDGFRSTLDNDFSDEVPEGAVIRTDPPAGTTLPEDSSVTIIVSAGPEQREVPDVIGETRATAVDEMENAGLQPRVTERTVDSGSPNVGRVLSTDPTPRTTVDVGTTVDIVVGRARQTGTTSSSTTAADAEGE